MSTAILAGMGGLIMVTAAACGTSASSTPTAQGSPAAQAATSPAAAPSASSGSGSGSADQASQCETFVAPLAQQLSSITSKQSGGGLSAVQAVQAEAAAYKAAATSAASDPELAGVLSSMAADTQALANDISNPSAANVASDSSKLSQDVKALEQICGTTGLPAPSLGS